MPAGIISLDVVGADEKGSRWLYASRLFVACILFGYFAQIYRQSYFVVLQSAQSISFHFKDFYGTLPFLYIFTSEFLMLLYHIFKQGDLETQEIFPAILSNNICKGGQ